MGWLNFLKSSPEKKLKNLQRKISEKYGPAENRQRALHQLVDWGTPEAISVLMTRFTINAEPSITDAEEKDFVCQKIIDFQEKAVAPLQSFLRRSEVATSWAVKILDQISDPSSLVAFYTEVLSSLGPEYTRDPEKKTVLISTLGDLQGEEIAATLIPFLEDPSDEVRIAAARSLAQHPNEIMREPLLQAFVHSSDRARVVHAIAGTLADTGFGVQGFREKITKSLPEDFYLSKSGVVKRRES
jgi:hypothetical protein